MLLSHPVGLLHSCQYSLVQSQEPANHLHGSVTFSLQLLIATDKGRQVLLTVSFVFSRQLITKSSQF